MSGFAWKTRKQSCCRGRAPAARKRRRCSRACRWAPAATARRVPLRSASSTSRLRRRSSLRPMTARAALRDSGRLPRAAAPHSPFSTRQRRPHHPRLRPTRLRAAALVPSPPPRPCPPPRRCPPRLLQCQPLCAAVVSRRARQRRCPPAQRRPCGQRRRPPRRAAPAGPPRRARTPPQLRWPVEPTLEAALSALWQTRPAAGEAAAGRRVRRSPTCRLRRTPLPWAGWVREEQGRVPPAQAAGTAHRRRPPHRQMELRARDSAGSALRRRRRRSDRRRDRSASTGAATGAATGVATVRSFATLPPARSAPARLTLRAYRTGDCRRPEGGEGATAVREAAEGACSVGSSSAAHLLEARPCRAAAAPRRTPPRAVLRLRCSVLDSREDAHSAATHRDRTPTASPLCSYTPVAPSVAP